MVLTKRQKVMVAVVGLGVGALLIDRVLLDDGQGGPQQAQAAAPSHVQRTVPIAPSVPSGTVLLDNSLASRLDSVREMLDLDLGATKDAFCPSDVWMAELRPDVAEIKPVQAEVSHERKGIDFGRSHQLKAVVASGANGGAFIDDKYVRMGQLIDGFRLVKVGYRTAVLEADGVQVELKLKVDPKDG